MGFQRDAHSHMKEKEWQQAATWIPANKTWRVGTQPWLQMISKHHRVGVLSDTCIRMRTTQAMISLGNLQSAPKYMDRIFTTISTDYINWFIMAIKWKEIAWLCLLAIEFLRSSEFNNNPSVNCTSKGIA